MCNKPLLVGIVADNYKLPTFDKELKAKGYVFHLHPYGPNATLIQVEADKKDVRKIAKICKAVEIYCKQSN